MNKFHRNKNTISFSFFRSMSINSILFMVLLFAGISVLFLRHSFRQQEKGALQELNYISQQFQFYLDSTENYSKTILSDDTVQEFLLEYQKDYLTAKYSPRGTTLVKQHIQQIIQSTPFFHSVTLYSDKGVLLVSTEAYANQVNLEVPEEIPTWQVGTKRHPHDTKAQVKTLSYIRPCYNISSGQLIGFAELAIPETQISAIYNEYNKTNKLFLIDQNGYVQSSNGTPELNSYYAHTDSVMNRSASRYFLAGGNLLFFMHFPSLNWYILNEIPVASFLQPLFTSFLLEILITVLFMILSVFTSHHTAQKITYPLNYLISHIQTVKKGNWSPIQEIPCNDEMLSLLRSFNSMISIQTQLKDELVEAEKHKRQLSLNLLQQQVNPHFLYNTLDNICSLAELDEKETLLQLVMNLSSFYRSSLSNGKMHVTIGQELDMARAYLEILQIRYFNTFDFLITCPENLKRCRCIKLLLQPILENSIYHGIKGLERRGRIEIIVEGAEDTVRFTISDNGRGFSDISPDTLGSEDSGHFGIKSIQQRIQLYYGAEYGLTMESPYNGGCITVITLPKQEVKPCL